MSYPPVVSFATREAWATWLEQHQEEPQGLWMKLARDGAGTECVDSAEALDAAIAHGWVDGQCRPLDETHVLQRFTPRRPLSRWSKANRELATALIERGEMRPPGLRAVEAAKADGRWEAAYNGHRAARVPPDLQEALDLNPTAGEFFATLTSQNRYAILYRIEEARRPEIRARRIALYVRMLADGRTLY